ncbi:hypothetical protein U0035_08595 [Niabella yanshanensis]|uniref:Lipoprotein n=1 Tax=Niabella yanshanensis TaxID=577386 RepID=A0ABZ0WAM1_9BACT|nr:hypothetical protein [Niabella yanshanensis]WQD40201.1 hypothetical protein U0035_08595 [Niabella yanshanensis]
MKLITLLAASALIIVVGCSKKAHSNRKEKPNSDFTFRAKKNGTNWRANSISATYNPKDSMMHVMALGDNNERFTISFFKKPEYTGEAKQFNAGTIIPTCEYCASIAQRYSLDSLKRNSFQILGFDNTGNRILGKFTVYLKKDSLYQGTFIKDSSLYEGVFSVRYETVSF